MEKNYRSKNKDSKCVVKSTFCRFASILIFTSLAISTLTYCAVVRGLSQKNSTLQHWFDIGPSPKMELQENSEALKRPIQSQLNLNYLY